MRGELHINKLSYLLTGATKDSFQTAELSDLLIERKLNTAFMYSFQVQI